MFGEGVLCGHPRIRNTHPVRVQVLPAEFWRAVSAVLPPQYPVTQIPAAQPLQPPNCNRFLLSLWRLSASEFPLCTAARELTPGRKLNSHEDLTCYLSLRNYSPASQMSSLWKESFHIFCLVFYVLTAQEQFDSSLSLWESSLYFCC